jgi:serine/threonine-protein kinase
LGGSSEQETVTLAHGAAARLRISSIPDEGRFPPGTLLGHRYRISNCLGKGGMGEVYKAADLLLGQTVALKFLPDSLLADEGMLERLRAEVRLARQVSHPNVCRVYDLGEAGGQPFLSMEFIDGEDLASLLRRIGHLPAAKSLEIAHKLCAGLAAAHQKGILHRDFKPANIMIDRRGQVLITDFGLAVVAGAKTIADPRSGTPAYMSPEQLTGAEVTARSDLYALGLVLYEMFAGQHAFGSGAREARPPVMKNIDPAVETVILRCLNTDPRVRPGTSLAVAAALPGGDPVAAALAAGETPTPGMVAALGVYRSDESEGRARQLWGAVDWHYGAGVGLREDVAIRGRSGEISGSDVGESSRGAGPIGISREAGGCGGLVRIRLCCVRITRQPARGRGQATDRRREDAGYLFFLSIQPRANAPQVFRDFDVNEGDPPLVVPGNSLVRLDPQGRLRYLRVVPPARDQGHRQTSPYEWSRLFERAGLDVSRFTSVAPAITPRQAFDTRGAWIQNDSTMPLRVEAAAWRGKPVWFSGARCHGQRLHGFFIPGPVRPQLSRPRPVLFIRARHDFNTRLSESQVGTHGCTGTTRVAVACGALGVVYAFLAQRFSFDLLAYLQLTQALMNGLFPAFVAGVGYLALAPFIRRRWPSVLVSWTRAWRGELRDPLVGRDLLLGLLSGVWLASIARGYNWICGPAGLSTLSSNLLSSVGVGLIAQLAYSFVSGLIYACWVPFLLVLAGILLRKRWLAICVTAVLFTVVLNVAGSPHPLLAATFYLPLYLGFFALA